MRTIDHALFAVDFGKKTLEIKSLIKLSAFILGNLSPDISYHTYLKSIGHGFSTARKKLALAWICEAHHGQNTAFYYRLGVASHYLCDSFTFPHNKQFKGTLNEHVRYEHIMHENVQKSFKSKCDILPIFSNPAACMHYLEKAHQSYIKYADKTPLGDIEWICAINETMLLSTISFSKNTQLKLWDLLGLKKQNRK
ncbi:MAG: zinc dependent phospholipase C family protein [Ruminococcus sp.]|nr:zinc dependent phospholipase C family protein [Ruminococcus sp.]